MKKFRNKYRIASHRLPGWDYSRNGYYYITIVTHKRHHFFGKIKNKKMILSDFGKIACDEWQQSFNIRKELILDEFIFMPNHLHAIVILYDRIKNENDDFERDGCEWDGCERDGCERNVETHGRVSQHSNQRSNQRSEPKKHTPKRKPKSISSFIGGYKSRVMTKIDDFIDENDLPVEKYNRQNPLWQKNYHDHIIRTDTSCQRIKKYIINNPENWKNDRFR